GTGGNNLAIQLVMDGLKLQPANPSFKDGRDAILRADQVLTGGANQAEIWGAFARRGMGLSFQDTGSDATTHVPAFDVPIFLSVKAQSPGGVVENQSFDNAQVAIISDPGGNNLPTDYTARIDWGDGTAPTLGTVTLVGANKYAVTAGHEYFEGGQY